MDKRLSYINTIDRYYLFFMVITATVVWYLNFYAESMSGLLPNYKAFAQVIKAEFNTTATDYYPLTFPM
jgi:hypothetical protein